MPLKKPSQYYKELKTQEEKDHYLSKLTLQNEVVLSDPYNIERDSWKTDVMLMPDIAYPDIYSYLVETPSKFTKEGLKANKSLDAFLFFLAGHVQKVYITTLKENKDFHAIETEVLPSQRQGQKTKMYKVWVIVHTKGWILSGNCTCMAGSVDSLIDMFCLLSTMHTHFYQTLVCWIVKPV